MKSHSLARLVLITALGMAFLPVGMDVYAAILSDLAGAFGVGIGWAQYALSCYLAGFAVAHTVVGPAADRYGRRPVMLGGLTLFTLASVAVALAPSVTLMLAARLVQGLGAAVGPIVVRAIVRDVSNPAEAGRTLAWGATCMGVVPVFGPWLASMLVVRYGWRAALWLIAAYGLVGTIAIAALLRETLMPSRAPQRFGGWLEALRVLLPDADFRRWAGCVALGFGGLSLWIASAASVLLVHYHVGHGRYGMYYAGITGGFILGSYAGVRALRRHSLAVCAASGAAFVLLSGGTLMVLAHIGAGSMAVIAPAIAIYPIGWGMIQPAAQAGAVAGHPEMAGRASAIYGFVQLCSGALAAAILGPLVSGRIDRLAIVYVAIAVGVILLTARPLWAGRAS